MYSLSDLMIFTFMEVVIQLLLNICLGSKGELLYAKLMREEILACDKELIVRAKKAGAIGGKFLRACKHILFLLCLH